VVGHAKSKSKGVGDDRLSPRNRSSQSSFTMAKGRRNNSREGKDFKGIGRISLKKKKKGGGKERIGKKKMAITRCTQDCSSFKEGHLSEHAATVRKGTRPAPLVLEKGTDAPQTSGKQQMLLVHWSVFGLRKKSQ